MLPGPEYARWRLGTEKSRSGQCKSLRDSMKMTQAFLIVFNLYHVFRRLVVWRTTICVYVHLGLLTLPFFFRITVVYRKCQILTKTVVLAVHPLI